jgi:hypothetical protein
MLIHIKKSFSDLFKEDFEMVLADSVLLIMIVSCMLTIDSVLKGFTITLFDVTYQLEVFISYLLGFVFILTTRCLFIDIRIFLNMSSRFVIMKFPRMQGNFSPGKAILRDLVQIVMLILVFYPLSGLFVRLSYHGIISYVVSLIFLILTLIFAYDITSNILYLISGQMKELSLKLAESKTRLGLEKEVESDEAA